MFNKKPRRNFRQRKDESSEEDENEKVADTDGTKETEKPIHFSTADLARRGFSSGSKSRRSDSSDAEEPAVTSLQSKDNIHSSKTNTLSFLEDKDCKYLTVISRTRMPLFF